MQHRVESVSEISRHTLENLATIWLTIVLLTVAVALLVSAGSAKADIIFPLPKAQLVTAPAVLKVFSSTPAPALIQQRCLAHLHPQQTNVALSNFSSRTQRNAESQGLQTIMAIKAYRQCVSQITLDQLASK